MEKNEVISLHIGKAGIELGNQCWELFSVEHKLGRDGISRKDDVVVDEIHDLISPQDSGVNFFQPTSIKGKNLPRCLFLDTEPSSINKIKLGEFRYFYSQDSFLSGKEDTSGPFSVGYISNQVIVDKAMEKIRKLAENCDNRCSFILTHGIGGGTGSGLTSRILELLNDTYEKRPKLGITILPYHNKFQHTSSVLETYNCMLSIPHLQEKSDANLLLSNDKVHEICQSQLNIETPKFEHMNEIMSQSVSFLTNSMRYDGALNLSISEFVGNLVPYPNISFITSSISPLLPNVPSSDLSYQEPLPTPQITMEVFKKYTFLADIDPKNGGFLGGCVCYRGDIVPKDVTFSTVKSDRSIRFVDWSPLGFKCGIQYHPFQTSEVTSSAILKVPRCASLFSNTTSVKEEFRRIFNRFKKIYSLKSYVHHYTQQGMEIEDFEKASECFKTLLHDYKEIEESSNNTNEEGEEEEDMEEEEDEGGEIIVEEEGNRDL